MNTTRPNAPKFPRGGLRAPPPGPLESETVYRGAAFEADLTGAEALNAVTFQGCVFRQVNLTGVHWRGVRLTDVRLEGCDLSGARLRHVALTRVAAPLSVWVKADAAHLRLDDCDLTEAMFMDADLPGLILRACRLPRTDLRGARLAGADLRSSDLRGLRVTPRELEGVTVDAAQLPDLAHLLGVRVRETLPDPDALP
ncbi:pentapeptide repeat-containing protein [Deinococcus knuensis]|uniref:Pentapeptide repeat-containing protein n=1 Tax=Deinococcus knuensis TaxID=1837380 RepID=A0ABQ2SE96_9DEIO|nr:pentapeptide repeat-containing protein [Deinococcus knuensis]GGS24512.1 hypothetical protein GCM10008961_15140 [Deinococcus knuensis]